MSRKSELCVGLLPAVAVPKIAYFERSVSFIYLIYAAWVRTFISSHMYWERPSRIHHFSRRGYSIFNWTIAEVLRCCMGLPVMYIVKFKMCALKLLGDTNIFFSDMYLLVLCEVHTLIHNSVFRTLQISDLMCSVVPIYHCLVHYIVRYLL